MEQQLTGHCEYSVPDQQHAGSNLLSNGTNWVIGYNIYGEEKFIGLKRLEIRNDIAENITITEGDSGIRLPAYQQYSVDLYRFIRLLSGSIAVPEQL